jgi:hypothetical protein
MIMILTLFTGTEDTKKEKREYISVAFILIGVSSECLFSVLKEHIILL